jgi:septal ring factor EnvC (AmiA/AmiB activator)
MKLMLRHRILLRLISLKMVGMLTLFTFSSCDNNSKDPFERVATQQREIYQELDRLEQVAGRERDLIQARQRIAERDLRQARQFIANRERDLTQTRQQVADRERDLRQARQQIANRERDLIQARQQRIADVPQAWIITDEEAATMLATLRSDNEGEDQACAICHTEDSFLIDGMVRCPNRPCTAKICKRCFRSAVIAGQTHCPLCRVAPLR